MSDAAKALSGSDRRTDVLTSHMTLERFALSVNLRSNGFSGSEGIKSLFDGSLQSVRKRLPTQSRDVVIGRRCVLVFFASCSRGRVKK